MKGKGEGISELSVFYTEMSDETGRDTMFISHIFIQCQQRHVAKQHRHYNRPNINGTNPNLSDVAAAPLYSTFVSVKSYRSK